MTLTFESDPGSVKKNQISRSKVISFESYRLHTHTHYNRQFAPSCH